MIKRISIKFRRGIDYDAGRANKDSSNKTTRDHKLTSEERKRVVDGLWPILRDRLVRKSLLKNKP